MDLIVTLFQAVFIGYALSKCLNEENNMKIFSVVVCIFITASDPVSNILGNFKNYASLISNLLIITMIYFLYKKKFKESFTVYSICTLILNIFSIICSNLIFEIIHTLFNIKDLELGILFIVYIPLLILIIFLIKNIQIVQNFYKYTVSESMEITIIVISIVTFFTVVFYKASLDRYDQLIKNGFQIIFAICIVILMLYFSSIYSKSKKIHALNEALDNKNNELRKIKHDYGAQISYLYGLALMERHDDLKKSLKNIIGTNQNTTEAVEVKLSSKDNTGSILSMAAKSAVSNGIHVIIEEEYDIKLLKINEDELYRIITNIVNNAVKAMNGKGILSIKTYEFMNKAVIAIENNGPKIPDENINHIFKAGFTTKNNHDMSHGYGLSIVKELVEKNSGNITVKSTEEKTVFKICFDMN